MEEAVLRSWFVQGTDVNDVFGRFFTFATFTCCIVYQDPLFHVCLEVIGVPILLDAVSGRS